MAQTTLLLLAHVVLHQIAEEIDLIHLHQGEPHHALVVVLAVGDVLEIEETEGETDHLHLDLLTQSVALEKTTSTKNFLLIRKLELVKTKPMLQSISLLILT